jgi:L-methionine (R)-S-oxide reductase
MKMDREQELESWLTRFLGDVQAVAGTIHLHENGGLRLGAAVNIPPPVRQAVMWVPSGKGMAGLALERGEPVQTCNLKEDASGTVKPGARAVDAKAAVAMPVRDREGWIVAVVGAAFADDREIEHEELERLRRASESLVGL